MRKAKNRPTTVTNPPKQPVVIAEGGEGAAYETLERVLQEALFWESLETERARTQLSKDDFCVLIKADFTYFDLNSCTGTAPDLVEHLIALLQEQGYMQVKVASGPDPVGLWFENREVLILAELAGYRFVTSKGISYEVLDLGEDIVVGDDRFPQESLLHREGISRHWLESHFRINFAKNKTDEEYYYALGLCNLLGILPRQAHYYHYQLRLKPWHTAVDLLQHAGIHFSIIDAWISNHDAQGKRFQNPLCTQTFIAGTPLLLVDWVAALKMGLDPYVSPINREALHRLGLPLPFVIKGNLSPYAGWKNVSRVLQESTFRRNELPIAGHLSAVWLQQVNTDLFPYKNMLDAQVNSWLSKLFTNPAQHPLEHWALLGLNYLFGNLHHLQESWKILYDKDRLYRQNIPLDIPLAQFSPSDYEAIEHYILPLAQVAHQTPPDRNGLRWRYMDESVLFEYSKIIQAPYSEFVKNVDIAKAVELMFDNIGSTRQTIKKDKNGRVEHQAERDIYLPQPNWMVFFGGSYIDVGKIEKIRYAGTQQEIYWRMVCSANQSAEFDDGMVVFAEDPGGTLVRIVARQKFALPLFWQVVDINYVPTVKNALVSDAYIRFFSRTMANFEATYEGRDPRIGRTYDLNYGQDGNLEHPLELEQFKELWALLAGAIGGLKKAQSTRTEINVDEHGYQHFNPSRAPEQESTTQLRNFIDDIGKAIQRDMGVLFNLNENKLP